MYKLVRFLRLLVPESDVLKALGMVVGTIAVLLLCGYAASALPRDVAERKDSLGGVLTLTDENAGCEKWGLLILRARLKDGEGKKFEGCFARVDGSAWILWDDGDRNVVPLAEFTTLPPAGAPS